MNFVMMILGKINVDMNMMIYNKMIRVRRGEHGGEAKAVIFQLPS